MNQAVLSDFGNLNEIEVLFLTLCRQEEKRLCGEEHEGTCMCVTLKSRQNAMEVEVGICGCACGAPRNFWNFFELPRSPRDTTRQYWNNSSRSDHGLLQSEQDC